MEVDQDASSATACECALTWEVDSVVPCMSPPSLSTENPFPSIVYSSHADEGPPNGGEGDEDDIPDCNKALDFPQPVPAEPWSKQRIKSSCAGSVRLCVSLKHGDADQPTDTDCPVMEYCFDANYDAAGQVLELPELPGWSATDAECSNQFFEKGYVEFRGEGELGCGDGPRLKRVQLCPAECASNPKAAACKNCGTSRLSTEF